MEYIDCFDYCNVQEEIPEGYIKPGNEDFLYINAYTVTRHFGGREEGGWWYNSYQPLASIPIKAVSFEGHSDCCYQCYLARGGHIDDKGDKIQYCKYSFELKPKDASQVEMFKNHLESLYSDLKEGDIYSVLGGTEILIVVEDHVAETYPNERPRYE